MSLPAGKEVPASSPGTSFDKEVGKNERGTCCGQRGRL